MKFTLILAATLASIAQASRYGLLRVGSSDVSSTTTPQANARVNSRSPFEEDFSLAFRQLFGYQAGLSLSIQAGAQLSLSMEAAPLSLSMQFAPLSLSMGASGMGEVMLYDAASSSSSAATSSSSGKLETSVNSSEPFTASTRGMSGGAKAASYRAKA